MPPLATRVFALPDRLAAAKDDPALIGADEAFFADLARTLDDAVADLTDRLAEVRRQTSESTTESLERDQEVHRLTARLRTLRRYGLDLCLGRVMPADGGPPAYVGRAGLTGRDGGRLLLDWRSPAAEPFFGATHADPMGLASRRRYRWAAGRIVDYWDEVFTADGLAGHAASLDDQSAFVASLGASRSPRMRDVLGTVQADQDAIIRAGSRGALVVDGGPGTGKTVVALHRTAYLLYSDPRLGHRRGGVLFVGPSRPYLSYVSDVLPSLGEEGVSTCTLRDLVPEGADAGAEASVEVARLKAAAAMVDAVEPAVALYEEPPTEPVVVETPWADLRLDGDDWVEAFDAPDPGTPHNEARDVVWEALLEILVDQVDDEEVLEAQLRRALRSNEDLVTTFGRAWPLLDPTEIVEDLWSVPAYLRRCAPWLTADEVRSLQRDDPRAWTTADLPLLDAARLRVGDRDASRRRQRAEAAAAAELEERNRVVEHLVETDQSDLMIMSMLRGADLQAALVDETALPAVEPDRLAGPFAHVVIDEAQELTDAEWRMVLRRCASRSLTVVGDRAQARRGFSESWPERLARVGLDHVEVATLSVNYRTPAEVMAEAEPVIRAALPDANVPTSIRETGVPVHHGPVAELPALLREWLAEHDEGTACVIAAAEVPGLPARVRSLTPELAKGLEFDLVVLLRPESLGAVDHYVALTRATRRLAVLS